MTNQSIWWSSAFVTKGHYQGNLETNQINQHTSVISMWEENGWYRTFVYNYFIVCHISQFSVVFSNYKCTLINSK